MEGRRPESHPGACVPQRFVGTQLVGIWFPEAPENLYHLVDSPLSHLYGGRLNPCALEASLSTMWPLLLHSTIRNGKTKTMLLPRTDRGFIYCSFEGPPCRFRAGIVLRLVLFSRPLQLIGWFTTLILFDIIVRFMVGI